MISADLNVILPEILLALFAILALLGAVYTNKDAAAGVIVWATAIVMTLLAIWIGMTSGGTTRIAFNGLFVEDSFARFAKVTMLLSAAAVLAMSEAYMKKRGLLRFEYPVLIALSVVGMMMMVSAGDLMTLYMGLELQSLALYVVASLRRDSVKSTEAGLKYFVLGALSSGLLLYGVSLVYGYAGTTQFAGVMSLASAGQTSIGLLFGIVFVVSGLAFKVSAVPFHMWTPDVYEGAPTPVTAFFATAPKVAAMALFARVLHDAFGNAVADWSQIVALLSVLSMFLGAVAAIGQTNIKRLMAYSSIAHMGYALAGLAAGSPDGATGVMIYMTGYVFMGAGTFSIILLMRRDQAEATRINDLKGLSRTHPMLALGLLVMMFSMAGIPPLAGFFGKWYVFLAAVQAGLVPLAVIGVVMSVIGAFYYLRIIRLMYFEDTDTPLDPGVPATNRMVLGVSLFVILLFFVGLGSLLDAADGATMALVASG